MYYNVNMNESNKLEFKNWSVTHSKSLSNVNINKHIHSQFEMLLFISGDGNYHIESSNYLLSPYTLLITKPMEYHFIDFYSTNTLYERTFISFNLEDFPKEIVEKINSAPNVLKLEATNRIAKLFKMFFDYCEVFNYKNNEEFYRSILTQIVYNVALVADKTHIAPTKEVSDITRKAIIFINKNILKPLTIENIAKNVYTSTSTLCHNFKNDLNISLMKYVRNKKLLIAEKMIKNGKKPTKVYYQCGFKDYTSFYRAYKEMFNKSPSDKQ